MVRHPVAVVLNRRADNGMGLGLRIQTLRLATARLAGVVFCSDARRVLALLRRDEVAEATKS